MCHGCELLEQRKKNTRLNLREEGRGGGNGYGARKAQFCVSGAVQGRMRETSGGFEEGGQSIVGIEGVCGRTCILAGTAEHNRTLWGSANIRGLVVEDVLKTLCAGQLRARLLFVGKFLSTGAKALP